MPTWHIEHVHQIESTNALAIARIQDAILRGPTAVTALDGLVIRATAQTAGRGQHGRGWASPLGGLYMSAVIANLPAPLRPIAALLAGIAVAEALQSAGIAGVGIRWPNDMVIDGKKVAGILCEGVAVDHHWMCVIGIGVNVNNNPGELPREIAARATTLFAHDGKRRDIVLLLNTILSRLDIRARSTPEEIVHAVQQRDALRGKHVVVQTSSGVVAGCAAGIDAMGSLVIATVAGSQSVPVGSIQTVDGTAIR
jgi:BirA family biotin operon repressor/biotin-[acetyl-CoA-carboxylase] ligase